MLDWGGGRYQQNPFWGPRSPLRPFLAMSNIYFFRLEIEKLFAQLDTDQNLSNLGNMPRLKHYLIFWSWDDLESKLSSTQIWGRVC